MTKRRQQPPPPPLLDGYFDLMLLLRDLDIVSTRVFPTNVEIVAYLKRMRI